jgi:hypothetical protein
MAVGEPVADGGGLKERPAGVAQGRQLAERVDLGELGHGEHLRALDAFEGHAEFQ